MLAFDSHGKRQVVWCTMQDTAPSHSIILCCETNILQTLCLLAPTVCWHLVPGGLAKICLAWIYQQWLRCGMTITTHSDKQKLAMGKYICYALVIDRYTSFVLSNERNDFRKLHYIHSLAQFYRVCVLSSIASSLQAG
jgi:hypothetical protein